MWGSMWADAAIAASEIKKIDEENEKRDAKKPKIVILRLKDNKGFEREVSVPFPPPPTVYVPIISRITHVEYDPSFIQKNEAVFHYVKRVSERYYEYEEQE